MVLVIPARGPAVVVAIVVPVPVAPVTVEIAWSFPLAISPISGTVTDTLALAVTVTVTVADALMTVVRSAIRRQEALCHAGLAVVTLPFCDGLATVGLVRVLLRAAAGPSRTSTGAVRSLTSALAMIRIPTVATPSLALCLVFLLFQPTYVLIKRGATGFFRRHRLKLWALSQTQLDLFVSVSDQNWGI